MNQSRAALILIVPMSSKIRTIASHVLIDPPEGGCTEQSDVMCEHIRSVSTERLRRYRGDVRPSTITNVESILQRLLAMTP